MARILCADDFATARASPIPPSPQRLIPSHPEADVLSAPLREMLLRAADLAAERLAHGDQVFASGMHEVLNRFVQVAITSSEHADGGNGNGTASYFAQIEVSPDVRDALRAALLRIATEDTGMVSGSELATLLIALEDPAPATAGERSNQFARQIAKSEAVNAVVEIAHDMRSPLTSILFLVDTLRRGRSGPVTTVQERQLGLIYGAALGLNTLACDVIDAVKGGQRLFDGHPTPFSIAEVIIGVCDTVRPISEEKGLPITYSLPSVDGRSGYPGALGRVLLNLLTNALKYTNEGSVQIGASELSETRLLFWVSDTGEGIPANVMARLFDGFRPTSTGIRFSNAGLGLAICQDFLRSMGTSLVVDSTPAAGTRFSFEIELQRA